MKTTIALAACFVMLAGGAFAATPAPSGPPAGTPRTISTAGLTQVVNSNGFTFYTNQTSGVVTYTTNNGTTTSSGTVTIGSGD